MVNGIYYSLMFVLWVEDRYCWILRKAFRKIRKDISFPFNNTVLGERGTLLHWWWECKLVQPFWKTVWRFLQKLKIELPYDPAVTLLGICPKDTKVVIRRGMRTQMFIAAMSTIAKLWREPRCPSTDEWIKKMWYIYTMEYCSHQKNPKSCHLQWCGWN